MCRTRKAYDVEEVRRLGKTTIVGSSPEVLVRVEAAPINPSDLGLLFAGADMSQASRHGTKGQPVVTARVPEAALKGMTARFDISMPVGNEGAGVVVEAGSSAAAQALLGKTVAYTKSDGSRVVSRTMARRAGVTRRRRGRMVGKPIPVGITRARRHS